MGWTEKRKDERVDTTVKVKLSGDAGRTECISSNVSAGGICFDTVRLLTALEMLKVRGCHFGVRARLSHEGFNCILPLKKS